MPTTLATYGPRLVARVAKTNPYYRAASYAYRYGPTMARAAGQIARWGYRRYKKRKYRGRRGRLTSRKKPRFSTTTIGERIGTSSSKVSEQKNTSLATKSTRTQYVQNLCTVSSGTTRSTRERGVINCRGFRICMSAVNDQNVPMYLNVAVVHGKVDETAVGTPNFFRSPETSRAKDFDNTLSSLEFHCLPINTDKYTILKHKRFILGPETTVAGDFATGVTKNWTNIDWYVKLKRQLRFDDSINTTPVSGNVWLVYWADLWSANSNTTAVATALRVNERHLMYFHEPKTG